MDFKSIVLLTVLLFVQFASLDGAIKPDILVSSPVGGRFPYVMALTSDNYGDPDSGGRMFLCNGILVSLKAVVTGASCIDLAYNPDITPNLDPSLRAVAGMNQWNPGLCSGAVSYEISHNVSYSDYTQNSTIDLGILFTTTCIQLSQSIYPIFLDFEYVGAGLHTKIAGWSIASESRNFSRDLYELPMKTLNNRVCHTKASHVSDYFTTNPDLEICVFNSSTSGACYGDTGGAPLVRTDRGTVVGMVTWGFPCGMGGPDLAIRFSAFKEWILKTIFNDYFLNKPSDWKAVGEASTNNSLWCS